MNAFKSALFLCFLLLMPSAGLQAHGSVTADGDLCLINIGFYSAHFKVFQPDTSQEKEFCEDLPAVGSSIFVMEYLHPSLAEVPIEFRIVRDTTGLGRFARLDDVAKIEDLDAVTVFHQMPVIESRVFSVLHEFSEAGDFLGIVTARHPETEQYYSAVFPFHVGARSWGLLPVFAVIALLSHLGYLFFTGRFYRWRMLRYAARQAGPKRLVSHVAHGRSRIVLLVPLLLLMGAADDADETAGNLSWPSESGKLTLSLQSSEEPLPLNRIHQWKLHLETADGEPVENATVSITGGMPAHNHGLPTDPVVTAYLGNGAYQVEGVRFHMQGEWVLKISITEESKRQDTVLVSLTL